MKHVMPITATLHRIVPTTVIELTNICSGILPYYVLCRSHAHATKASKSLSRTLCRLKNEGRINKQIVVRQSKHVIRICNRSSFAEQIPTGQTRKNESVLAEIVSTPSTPILDTEELLTRLVEDESTPISYSD